VRKTTSIYEYRYDPNIFITSSIIMSLKNRLSTVEVAPNLLRNNSAISPAISKPTRGRLRLFDKLRIHSKKHSMPKTLIFDAL